MISLYIRTAPDSFTRDPERFYSYAAALAKGRSLAGPGNFYVDTGDFVPSREELLGEAKPKSRKQKLLDTL